MRAGKLGEPGPHACVREQPRHDLLERRRHRRELGRDHLVQGHRPSVELGLYALVDLRVAELPEHEVERVPLGDGSIPVEDDSLRRCRHRGSLPARLAPHKQRGVHTAGAVVGKRAPKDVGKDYLDGGKGKDRADGGPARDVCHAERKVHCP